MYVNPLIHSFITVVYSYEKNRDQAADLHLIYLKGFMRTNSSKNEIFIHKVSEVSKAAATVVYKFKFLPLISPLRIALT